MLLGNIRHTQVTGRFGRQKSLSFEWDVFWQVGLRRPVPYTLTILCSRVVEVNIMQLLIIMLATTCTQTTTHNLPHIRSRIGQGSPPNAMELIDLFFATLQEKSNIGNAPCGPFLSRLPNYHTKERMPYYWGDIFFLKKPTF